MLTGIRRDNDSAAGYIGSHTVLQHCCRYFYVLFPQIDCCWGGVATAIQQTAWASRTYRKSCSASKKAGSISIRSLSSRAWRSTPSRLRLEDASVDVPIPLSLYLFFCLPASLPCSLTRAVLCDCDHLSISHLPAMHAREHNESMLLVPEHGHPPLGTNETFTCVCSCCCCGGMRNGDQTEQQCHSATDTHRTSGSAPPQCPSNRRYAYVDYPRSSGTIEVKNANHSLQSCGYSKFQGFRTTSDPFLQQ